MLLDLLTRARPIAFKAHQRIASVADIVDHQLGSYGDRPCIRYDDGESYRSISFLDYQRALRAAVRIWQSRGLVGQVIATLCKNRLEWDMVALSAFYTGNSIFPLDTKTNAVELDHLLRILPPDWLLVSWTQLGRARELKLRHGLRTTLLVADLTRGFEDQGSEAVPLHDGELLLSALVDLADDTPVTPSPSLADPGTVLGYYPTSGTTALPKVVRITHGNIVHEVNCGIDVLNLRPNEDLLNLGPYTHIATLVEFLVTKTRGFTVTYFTREPDDDDVLEDEIEKLKRQGVRIKALLAVPKFWIYLLKEVLEEMKNKPILHNLYRHLTSIEKQEDLHDIGTIDKAKLTAVRILLRNKLGGYFSYGISSSMKIDQAVVQIFGKLGVTVIDIYGATEASGIIARNRLDDILPGSCGRVIPELEWRVDDLRRVPGIAAEVGVLKIRGPTVAAGYVVNQHSPHDIRRDADGWLDTGDLAWVAAGRIVHLVGREKELLRWDDGSYIDPQYLSNLLVRSIFVKDAMVARVRPDDRRLSVFVYPDWKRLRKDPNWQKDLATGVGEDAALKARIVEAIRYAESIAQVTPELDRETVFILPKALERTPTHKIKYLFELQRVHLARRL